MRLKSKSCGTLRSFVQMEPKMKYNDIDKNEYPLDIVFVPDEDGGHLIEGGKKYIPISSLATTFFAPLSLRIVSPITYEFSVGEFHGRTIYTEAEMIGWDSISFFGTDRKIDRMSVEIYPIKEDEDIEDEVMQLQFRGGLSEGSMDIEEHIQISLAVPNSQFEGIMRLLDRDNIDEIFLSLKQEIINGLYNYQSFIPWNEFKILPNKKMVKNFQDLPENFSDFYNSQTYYVSKDCFRLKIRNKTPFKTNEEQSDEDEKDILSKEEAINVREIKEYARYAVAILTAILITILLKY